MKIGDNLNGYIIVKYIGAGGMGTVWKVNKNGIDYALKICTSKEEDHIKRFKREYRLMKNLEHPYVLKAIEDGVYDGDYYFVMELADCSLEDAVETGISTKLKFEYARQLCEGIFYIHESGETHRDIKPANILIKGGVIKIADFGLGRFVSRDSTTLTSTTETWGTYGYDAPELHDEGKFKEGSSAVDIFALGCTLYFVFSDGSLPQYMNHKMVSSDVYPIFVKCREIEPDDRYKNANEIEQALNNIWAARGRYKTLTALAQDKDKLGSGELAENALPLFYQSGGIEDMLSNFKVLSTLWHKIYNVYPNCVDDVISFILKTWDADNNYWLQFEDTEVLANMAVLLCPLANDPALKSRLFEVCFSSAVGASRWAALRNLNDNIIKKWDDKTIAPYTEFISRSEELFDGMNRSIGSTTPAIVRNLFIEKAE